MKSKNALLVQPPKSIFKGASTLSRGLSYSLRHFKILLMCVIPLLIALVVLFVAFAKAYAPLLDLLEGFALRAEWFSFWGGSILKTILYFFMNLVVAVLVILSSYILLQIVYIPICSWLAESILAEKGIIRHKSFVSFMLYNLRMFRVGLLKSVILLFLGLLCFVFSFFPFLGFLPLYFGLIVLAYDSYDYGLELYGLNLSERFSFFKKEFLCLNGHAAVLFALTVVPGLVLLTLPFSVVGASLILGETHGFKTKTS